jgi:hypothetical protein
MPLYESAFTADEAVASGFDFAFCALTDKAINTKLMEHESSLFIRIKFQFLNSKNF